MIELAADIRDADYRGELARLRTLHERLNVYTRRPSLARAAHYWRGFALWRRALNAANENGSVTEITRDFEDSAADFERALAIDSTYVEAHIGYAAGLMNVAHFRRAETARSAELMMRATRAIATARQIDANNPRLIFVLATRVFWAPPEYGGSRERAVELVEAALARYSQPPMRPTVEPTWGDAELHMLLAFFKLNLTPRDLAGAEQHARAALAMRPSWHYVRDLLLPQIAAQRR